MKVSELCFDCVPYFTPMRILQSKLSGIHYSDHLSRNVETFGNRRSANLKKEKKHLTNGLPQSNGEFDLPDYPERVNDNNNRKPGTRGRLPEIE